MERETERTAFAKACRYLNYNAAAKWTAHAAAAGTALIYVALLVVLWLFADLVVHRGGIPAFRDLRQDQQEAVLADSPSPEKLSAADKEALWREKAAQILEARVGTEAAEAVRARPADEELGDLGILSLVVRSDRAGRLYTPFVGWLARWNGWLWQRGAFAYLTGLALVAAGLIVLRTGLAFLMREAAARAVLEASTRLRRAVYHHTFRLGTLAFRALGPSEAVTVFTRHIEAVHEALYVRLTVSYREPIKFGLLLAFALFVNWLLTLVFLLAAVFVWLVGGQLAASYRRQVRAATSSAAERVTLMRESLMMMRLVKTYLMELFNQSRVERLLARYARDMGRRYRGEAAFQVLLMGLGSLAGVGLVYYAGLVVLSGQLGVGGAITLATALVSLYWPVERWLASRRMMRRGRESAVPLFGFLERPGEVGQAVGAEFLPPMSGRLEFDNVSLREPGGSRMLLQEVSFAVPAGKQVGLVGADDLEKHALIYLIPRLLDPSAGEIRIDKNNLRWVTLDSLRAQTAIVLQHNLVFHDTVANNIGCGDPGFTLPQIIEAAKLAHAHHFIQKLPAGYETVVGEQGYALNVGEQFRVALARAILRDPAILVIEEPEVPLDEDTKSLLDDTFTRILPGRTTIFLPHRISTINACDRIYLLHKGRVEAMGSHRDLLSQNHLYRHLHYIEFNEMVDQL